MKKKFLIVITFSLIFILSACVKIILDDNTSTEGDITVVTPSVKDTFLAKSAGIYESSYLKSDYNVSLSALRDTPIGEEQFVASTIPNTEALSKGGLPEQNYVISINGVDITATETKSSSQLVDFTGVFGKNVTFGLQAKSRTSSEVNADTTVNMYVPQTVNITSPKISTERELFPYCYYKGFTLEWNADQDNESGLIVCVEWLGVLINGQSVEGSFVRNSDFIAEDNGRTVLNDLIFDGIPDSALVYITLLRGNIQHLSMDEISYKLSGQSSIVLPIVLVRELKDVV